MGAIADGSAKIYTKDFDIAQYNRTYGNDKHSFLGLTLSSMIPQILAGVSNTLGEKINSEDNNSSESDNKSIEVIQEDINKKLGEVGCSDISEVEAKIEQNQVELSRIENNIDGLNSTIQNCNSRILSLKTQIEYLESLPSGENNNAQINELKTQLEALETQLETAQIDLEEAQKYQEVLSGNIAKYKDAENEIKILEKQLKKIAGKESVDNLINEDTGSITKLLKELRKAQESGNSNKINVANTNLQKAKESYYENHKEGDNKTIDNLFRTWEFQQKTNNKKPA